MAKELLKEVGSLVFPELVIERSADDRIGMRQTKKIQVEEVAATSFAQQEKKQKVRRMGHANLRETHAKQHDHQSAIM
jgi:hypothetical protein